MGNGRVSRYVFAILSSGADSLKIGKPDELAIMDFINFHKSEHTREFHATE